jgi:hypothetical protein
MELVYSSAADNAKLELTSGVTVRGEAVTLLLLTTELSALGTFVSRYGSVADGGNKCHTPGDSVGVVLLSGEFHVVRIESTPLTLGLLFLPAEAEVLCEGGTSILVRGELVSSLESIGSEVSELIKVSSLFAGEKGKNTLTKFFNGAGEEKTAELEAEAGEGFVQADIAMENEAILAVQGSKMLAITAR